MREGMTKTGFSYSYDESRLDDMRMVKLLEIIMGEDTDTYERMSASDVFARKLLGEEVKELLYEHIGKSHEGRVPYAALSAEISDIMLGSTETKN